MSRGPIDRRLLHATNASRRYFAFSLALGIASALLVVGQAAAIARFIVSVYPEGAPRDELIGPALTIVILGVLRGGVSWLSDGVAHVLGSRAKAELRSQLWQRLDDLSFDDLARLDRGRLLTLETRGIDALDGYFSRYLTQLVLASVVPPLLVAVILWRDWTSALTFFFTIPAIPIFMILIGKLTEAGMKRQYETLSALSSHFLEVVRGLVTLRTFGKGAMQRSGIELRDQAFRRATMRNLRWAFLSGATLELLSTLGIAFIAVSVGIRLIDGNVSYETALLVLLLAPEVFAPLRTVGAQFHANAEGKGALDELFAFFESTPEKPADARNGLYLTGAAIMLSGVTFSHNEEGAAELGPWTLRFPYRKFSVISGPSGVGKSSLMSLLLGERSAQSGSIQIGDVSLDSLNRSEWREHVSWVPQHPTLFNTSIAENVRIARRTATDEELESALRKANAWEFVAKMPEGMQASVGEGGQLLSAGQAQRVALARCFVRKSEYVLLDEPTAHLDSSTAAEVLIAVRRLLEDHTVIMVTHDPTIHELADVHWELP